MKIHEHKKTVWEREKFKQHHKKFIKKSVVPIQRNSLGSLRQVHRLPKMFISRPWNTRCQTGSRHDGVLFRTACYVTSPTLLRTCGVGERAFASLWGGECNISVSGASWLSGAFLFTGTGRTKLDRCGVRAVLVDVGLTGSYRFLQIDLFLFSLNPPLYFKLYDCNISSKTFINVFFRRHCI